MTRFVVSLLLLAAAVAAVDDSAGICRTPLGSTTAPPDVTSSPPQVTLGTIPLLTNALYPIGETGPPLNLTVFIGVPITLVGAVQTPFDPANPPATVEINCTHTLNFITGSPTVVLTRAGEIGVRGFIGEHTMWVIEANGTFSWIRVEAGHAAYLRTPGVVITQMTGILLPPIIVETTDVSGNLAIHYNEQSEKHEVTISCVPTSVGKDEMQLTGKLTVPFVAGRAIFEKLIAEGKEGFCDIIFESEMHQNLRNEETKLHLLMSTEPHNIEISLVDMTQTETFNNGAVISIASESKVDFHFDVLDRGGNILSNTFCRVGGNSHADLTDPPPPILHADAVSESMCILIDIHFENHPDDPSRHLVEQVKSGYIEKYESSYAGGGYSLLIPDFTGYIVLEARYQPRSGTMVYSSRKLLVVDKGAFNCIHANPGAALSDDLARFLLDESTLDEVSATFFDLSVPPPPFVRFNISSLDSQEWYFNLPAHHQYWVLMQSPFYIEVDPVLSEYFCFGFSYARVDDLNIYIRKPFCNTADSKEVIKELAALLYSIGDRSVQYHKAKGSQVGYSGVISNFTGFIPQIDSLSVCVGDRILSPATTGYDVKCCDREDGTCETKNDSHSLQTAVIVSAILLTTIASAIHLGWVVRCLRKPLRLCPSFKDTEDVSQKMKVAFVHAICPVFPVFSVIVNYEYVYYGHPLVILWSVEITVIGLWYISCLLRLLPVRSKATKRFYEAMVFVLCYVSLWLLWAALVWSLPSIVLETRRTLVPFVCYCTLLAHTILKPGLISTSQVANSGMFEVAVMDTQEQLLDSLIGTAVFAFFLTLLVYSLNNLAVVTDTQVILAIVVVVGIGFFMSWSLSGRLSAALRRTLAEVTEKVSTFVAELLARRTQQTNDTIETTNEEMRKKFHQVHDQVHDGIEKNVNEHNALVQKVGQLLSGDSYPDVPDLTAPLQPEDEEEEYEESEDLDLPPELSSTRPEGAVRLPRSKTAAHNSSLRSDGMHSSYVPPSLSEIDRAESAHNASQLSGRRQSGTLSEKNERGRRGSVQGFNSSGKRKQSVFSHFADLAQTVADNASPKAGATSPPAQPSAHSPNSMKRNASFWGDPEAQKVAAIVRTKSVNALTTLFGLGGEDNDEENDEDDFVSPKVNLPNLQDKRIKSPELMSPLGIPGIPKLGILREEKEERLNAGMSPEVRAAHNPLSILGGSVKEERRPSALATTPRSALLKKETGFLGKPTKSPVMLFGDFADDVERLLGDSNEGAEAPPRPSFPLLQPEADLSVGHQSSSLSSSNTTATTVASSHPPSAATTPSLAPRSLEGFQRQMQKQNETTTILLRFDDSIPLGFHLSKQGALLLERVDPGSVADEKGLAKEIGRMLISVNCERVSTTKDVRRLTKASGMRVELTFTDPPPIPAALRPINKGASTPQQIVSPALYPNTRRESSLGSATIGSMPLSIDGPMLQTIEYDEPWKMESDRTGSYGTPSPGPTNMGETDKTAADTDKNLSSKSMISDRDILRYSERSDRANPLAPESRRQSLDQTSKSLKEASQSLKSVSITDVETPTMQPSQHLSQQLLTKHTPPPAGMRRSSNPIDDGEVSYADIPRVDSRRFSAATCSNGSSCNNSPRSVLVDPLLHESSLTHSPTREAIVGCLRKGKGERLSSPEGRPVHINAGRHEEDDVASHSEAGGSAAVRSPRSPACSAYSSEGGSPSNSTAYKGVRPAMHRANSNVGVFMSILSGSGASPPTPTNNNSQEIGGSVNSASGNVRDPHVSRMLPLTHLNSIRSNLESIPDMIDDTSDRMLSALKEKSRAISVCLPRMFVPTAAPYKTTFLSQDLCAFSFFVFLCPPYPYPYPLRISITLTSPMTILMDNTIKNYHKTSQYQPPFFDQLWVHSYQLLNFFSPHPTYRAPTYLAAVRALHLQTRRMDGWKVGRGSLAVGCRLIRRSARWSASSGKSDATATGSCDVRTA